jgi:hypothetical protein
VNTLYDASRSYDGNVDHWLVREPTGWSTCFHELGHTQQRQAATFQYQGETEAIVNFLWTCAERPHATCTPRADRT